MSGLDAWIVTKDSDYILLEEIAQETQDASDTAKYLGILQMGALTIKDKKGNEYYIIPKQEFDEWHG